MVSRVADDGPKPDSPQDRSGKAVRETDEADTAKPAQSDAVKPTASSEPPTPRRCKLAPSKTARSKSLKADIDRLEARLKRADASTQKNRESLQTIVSALEANLKTSTDAQKGQQTQYIDTLTSRLDQQSTDMRTAVRKELKSVLSEGGLDYLDAAIGRASIRLDKAEIEQADAIAKVNKHLADIARVVDARMKEESRNRKAELDTLTEKLTLVIATSQHGVEKRVTAVERDSAEALNRVGAIIEQIHNRLEQRRQSSREGVAEKVNELALQTQAEMGTYQAKLEAQMKEVEARHLAVGTGSAERVFEKVSQDIEHKIDGLQRRITELERGANSAPEASLAPLPPLPEAIAPPVKNLREPSTGTDASEMPPNPIQTLKDHLTSFRSPSTAPTLVPLPAAPADPSTPYAAALDGVSPLPLDPSAQAPVAPQSAPTDPAFQSVSLSEHAYSTSAYAEDINTRAGLMARSRLESPMAVQVASNSPRQRFSLSSRTVRGVLLATGVAVVALMAGRMILSTGDATDSIIAQGGQPAVVTNSFPSATFPPRNTTPTTDMAEVNPGSDPSTQPIGNYAETQPIVIDSAKLDTLEAAVEVGNPIAQFQMGLAELDAEGRKKARP